MLHELRQRVKKQSIIINQEYLQDFQSQWSRILQYAVLMYMCISQYLSFKLKHIIFSLFLQKSNLVCQFNPNLQYQLSLPMEERKGKSKSNKKRSVPPVGLEDEQMKKYVIGHDQNGTVTATNLKSDETGKQQQNWNIHQEIFKKINQWTENILSKSKPESGGEPAQKQEGRSEQQQIKQSQSKKKIVQKQQKKNKAEGKPRKNQKEAKQALKNEKKEKNKESRSEKEQEVTAGKDKKDSTLSKSSKKKPKQNENSSDYAGQKAEESEQQSKKAVKNSSLKKKKSSLQKSQSSNQQIYEEQEDRQQEQSDFQPQGSQEQAQSKKTTNKSRSKAGSEQPYLLNKKTIREKINNKMNNFYLRRQQLIKQGLPLRKGKRAIKQFQDQIRKRQNQQTYRNNYLRKQVKEGKNPLLEIKGVTNDSNTQPFGETEEEEETQVKKEFNAESQVKQEHVEDPIKVRAPKRNLKNKMRKYDCTKEESLQILKAFSMDGGNYRDMVKDLGYSLTKIRRHLRMHFTRALEIITSKTQQSGRKIKDWELFQRREIIRELHRIRSTNRLLSQQNDQFRLLFQKLMMSYNDTTLTFTDSEYNFLYRKIESFVRGYCSVGSGKKKSDIKLQEKEGFEQNRPPLLEGGYIMDKNRIKRELKVETKLEQPEKQNKKIDPEKIIFEWTEEEEKELANLFMKNQQNSEAIIDQLSLKFGQKNQWKDFQLLNRKLNHLVKLGLQKLQQLTSRPYNRQERQKQDEEKRKKQSKLIDACDVRTQVSSLDLLTTLIYNNKKANKEDNQEKGHFTNVSLLERRIFSYVESFQARVALAYLMVERFPPQQSIDNAIKVTQQFIDYVADWQKKNGIIRHARSIPKPKPSREEKEKEKDKPHFSFARGEDDQQYFKDSQFNEILNELNDFQKRKQQKQKEQTSEREMAKSMTIKSSEM